MSAPPRTKAFPAVSGGCYCQRTRYRLLTAPLFCYACHCPDCQRRTGSAFACFATIEVDRVVPLPNYLAPKVTAYEVKPGVLRDIATCSKCNTQLWAGDSHSTAIVNIQVGTLDLPTLMEPDIHCFVGSKVTWVGIPEGVRMMNGPFKMEETWPKESLRRFEIAAAKAEQQAREQQARNGVVGGSEGVNRAQPDPHRGEVDEEEAEDEEQELDKTPTAQSPSTEEDVEFERRCDETEKELLARLEVLTIKLAAQEKSAEGQGS